MNKDKINETANLVDLDGSQIVKSKFRLNLRRLIYSFSQIGVIGINAIFGFAFGGEISFAFHPFSHVIVNFFIVLLSTQLKI